MKKAHIWIIEEKHKGRWRIRNGEEVSRSNEAMIHSYAEYLCKLHPNESFRYRKYIREQGQQ